MFEATPPRIRLHRYTRDGKNRNYYYYYYCKKRGKNTRSTRMPLEVFADSDS